MNAHTAPPIALPERRPMFTRDWSISKQTTGWLVACRVPPNVISLVGMAGGIAAGLALAATPLTPWPQVLFLVAVAGIVLRGMGNLLDGMVAVASGQACPLGELYNEVPDRISDIAILVGAGFAMGGNTTLGLWAALTAVLVAYVRAAGKVAGAQQHYCGPMGKPGRMVLVLLISLYCGVTPAAWQPVFRVGGGSFGLMAVGLAIVVAGGVLTVIRRLKRIAVDVAAAHYPVRS